MTLVLGIIIGGTAGFTICNFTMVADTQRRLEQWRDVAQGRTREPQDPST